MSPLALWILGILGAGTAVGSIVNRYRSGSIQQNLGLQQIDLQKKAAEMEGVKTKESLKATTESTKALTEQLMQARQETRADKRADRSQQQQDQVANQKLALISMMMQAMQANNQNQQQAQERLAPRRPMSMTDLLRR